MTEHVNGRRDVPVTNEVHDQLLHDLTVLHASRLMLVERLERVIVALALTLDAEAAAELRLAEMQDLAGARRIGPCRAEEWTALAQRYRDVIHALEAANDDIGVGGAAR